MRHRVAGVKLRRTPGPPPGALPQPRDRAPRARGGPHDRRQGEGAQALGRPHDHARQAGHAARPPRAPRRSSSAASVVKKLFDELGPALSSRATAATRASMKLGIRARRRRRDLARRARRPRRGDRGRAGRRSPAPPRHGSSSGPPPSRSRRSAPPQVERRRRGVRPLPSRSAIAARPARGDVFDSKTSGG